MDNKDILWNTNEDTSKNQIHLTQAIWYVSYCRKLQMPNPLQRRILHCLDGKSLWASDIEETFNRIEMFDSRCSNCIYRETCEEPDIREMSFISRRRNDCKTYWFDTELRNNAIRQSAKYHNRNICAQFITDSNYPKLLRHISGCPAVIFCEGKSPDLINKSPLRITIVGTRDATPYGLRATEILAEILAEYECIIISGLAKGIDAVAHKSVLRKGGMTAAVTAGATDIYYPSQNRELQQEIAASGLVISEQPPGTRPIKQFFPARNRLLSGIADIVIVTESPEHSGTLITASFAGDQSRDIFAVPGNIFEKNSTGCNRLIRDGAELLDDPVRIIEQYHLKKRYCISNDEKLKTGIRMINYDHNNCPRLHKLVLEALKARAMDISELIFVTSVNIDQLGSVLTELEIRGRIKCRKGQYFLTYQ